MTTTPEARAGVRFWILVALFLLLIVGTLDIAIRLWSGDLEVCGAACGGGILDLLAWLAWYLAANGLILTAGVLVYWLARCLLGWWRSRRRDDGTVASHGGGGWILAIVLLLGANAAGAALLVADALHAAVPADAARSWVDVITLASNAWVLAYYARRRRWDGRRP